jgi:hypothetical protein
VTTDVLAVAHALPGRVRLRLPADANEEGLSDAVSALEGVIACAWTPRTRGLLVRYDPAVTDAATIVDHVADHAGVEAPEFPAGGVRHSAGALPPVRVAVPALFTRANQSVAQATRGLVDLAGGLPLALVAWAAFELLRGRRAPLPWSSALWYAHGLFRDYNLDRP